MIFRWHCEKGKTKRKWKSGCQGLETGPATCKGYGFFLNKTIPHLSYENWFTCIYMYKIPKTTFKRINLTVKNYATINLEKKINTD